MSLDFFHTVCKKINIEFPKKFRCYEKQIELLHLLDHVYIDYPEKFRQDLNSLVHIFDEVKLLVVHETRGYMMITDPSIITFYRITRGHPRFKIAHISVNFSVKNEEYIKVCLKVS